MRRLLTALSCVIAMACALPLPTLAQDLPIVGVWEGADRAALSIYGTLKVSRTGMS